MTKRGHGGSLAGGIVLADEGADFGVGFGLPAAAVKDAVMADRRLQVVGVPGRREVAAKAVRRDGLADRADVVLLALDGHQRGLLDRAGIDRLAMHPQRAVR